MRKFLCKIGIHQWEYYQDNLPDRVNHPTLLWLGINIKGMHRKCMCGKKQFVSQAPEKVWKEYWFDV